MDTSPPSKRSQSHRRQILKEVIHKQLHDYNCDKSYEGKVQRVISVFNRRLVCSLWEKWHSTWDLKNGGYDDACMISAISNHVVWYYPISTAEETEAHNVLRSVHTEQGLRIQVSWGLFLPCFHHTWGCPWWPRRALQIILPISTIYFLCSFVKPSN